MFSRKDVAQMLDIPPLRVKFYTEQGFCPGFDVKTGKGNERRYSENDVVFLAIAKTLAEAGISLQLVKRFFNHIETKNEVSRIPGRLKFGVGKWNIVLIKKDGKQDADFYITRVIPQKGNTFEFNDEIAIAMIFNLSSIYKSIDWPS